MARKVNYPKKIENIKSMLDELGEIFTTSQKEQEDGNESTIQKFRLSDIDLEQEETKTLIKLQAKIARIISKRL